MIIAPTPCYFILKAEGDACAQLMAEVSPRSASDIDTVILISSDFDSDILAVSNMDQSIKHIQDQTLLPASRLTIVEQYNPLYVPGKMEDIDEMLHLEPRSEGIRFVGMNGSPFTFKTVEITDDGSPLIMAKIDYRPFDIPSYSDIVASHETQLN